MPSYRYYNIQMLPLDTKRTPNIGVKGYENIWAVLRRRTIGSWKTKRIHTLAGELPNSRYLTPSLLIPRKGYMSGNFIRIEYIDALHDIYGEEEPEKIGWGKSSEIPSFHFVFDYEKHIMAISTSAVLRNQKRRSLPNKRALIPALHGILEKVTGDLYPGHTLKIIELSEADALKPVYRAKGYQLIDVNVTFSNSDIFDDHLEQMYRENNAHKVSYVERSDKGSQMPRLSKLSGAFLKLVSKFGHATVRYISPTGERKKYDSDEHPVENRFRTSKSGNNEKYDQKIYESIADADSRTR